MLSSVPNWSSDIGNEEYYILDLEGNRIRPYRYSIRGDWDSKDNGSWRKDMREIAILTAKKE